MKVKVNLNGFGPIEIDEENPEVLAKLLKSLSERSEPDPIEKDDFEISNNIENHEVNELVNTVSKPVLTEQLTADPMTSSIIQYILSKPEYEHYLGELMDNIFGKHLKPNEDRKSYDSFMNKVRHARKLIERKYGIKWESSRSICDQGAYPLVYKIKKSSDQSNQNESVENDQTVEK